ncbi:TPA: hypothetical protein ACT9ME_001603 [Legionella pneumophila]
MDFIISDSELEALCGLPHLQQLTYIRGIRPYMDVKTGTVGIKRGISYQSISEQLYIEPHQGIKAESFSRAQVRRAVESLERAGLIQNQSKEKRLILKCLLASRAFCNQNKVITNPSQQAVIVEDAESPLNTGYSDKFNQKAGIANTPKADTPHKDNNYLYLLSQFEQFWNLYPERKSKTKAIEAFQLINPDESLFRKIMQGLQAQIDNRKAMQMAGNWVPPWKYPANWLEHQCWEDSITPVELKENNNATNRKRTQKSTDVDLFYTPDITESEHEPDYEYSDNIVSLQNVRNSKQAY